MNTPTSQPIIRVASDELLVRAENQVNEGPVWKGRGMVEIRTNDMILRADEIDYDRDRDYAEARGNVHFENLKSGEKMDCDKAEYYLDKETGRFYQPRGTSPAKIDARPGLLVTSNPFYFQGEWAEKLKEQKKDGTFQDRYVLHNGFVTDCKVPNPAWTLKGPKFDIIPGDRAVAYNTFYRVRGVPLFFSPIFYKSLKRLPRRSGFLMPNLGNSSRFGFMVGAGYYWAINRSYDLMYRGQWFTTRGLASTVDFRGRPTEGSEFNFYLYDVRDRGTTIDGNSYKYPGYFAQFNGKAKLGKGFNAFTQINYLSSFAFRQEFTQSFFEAISAETHSVAYIEKHWSSFGFYTSYQRDVNFQTTTEGDQVLLRKLPEVRLVSRDRNVGREKLPVYVSFDSTFGFLHRDQPQFQTKQYVDRADFQPRISTAFHFKGFSLIPSFSIRGTHYGASFAPNRQVMDQGIWRNSREALAELVFPSVAKIGKMPKMLGGGQYKHVIETRASVRHAAGVNDFNRVVLFDSTDLVANSSEVEVSIANRLYTKDKAGTAKEVMSWELWQRRYLDPTFGGAIVPGRRNVIDSSVGLTPFAFLDGTRHYSPIVSSFRLQPNRVGIEWRSDYDPARMRFVNSTFTADSRWSNYYLSAGHAQIRNSEVLSPNSNQFRASAGFGNENRRGINVGTYASYDYRVKQLQYVSVQVTKNWDCCGVSVQYRKFDFGTRQDNQFRVAFAVANIGSFGTLRRQERLF